MSMVIEWAPFRLAPNVTEAELLRASDALEADFLAQQPGYLRRDLLRQDDETWCDLVYWESAAAAEQAVQHARSSAACRQYFNLMVGPDGADAGADLRHLAVKKSYPAAS
jgi:hypothetical protein